MFKSACLKIIVPALLLFYLENVFASKLKPDSIIPDTATKPGFCIIKSVEITGNKKTKKQIIIRELLFKENDTIDNNTIETFIKKSRENLLNTSLFNFVKIETSYIRDDIPSRDVIPDKYQVIKIKIDVLERWYIWPIPIVELSVRNFNSWWQTKDFGRINYGFYLRQDNFRGRKETVTLLFRYGYDETFSISYMIPYINRKQTIGLGLSGGLSRNHEIAYNTIENKLKYHKDKTNYPLTKTYTNIQLHYRPDIYNTHYVDFNYNHNIFNDTLNSLNKNFSFNNQTNIEFLTLHYKFANDFRDSKPYPLRGHYFDVDVSKYGLGFLSANTDLLNIHSSYNKYWQLSKKYFFAAGLIASYTNKNEQPYYLASSVGFGHDNIRSYDYYVINGQYFGVAKLNLKYELVPTQVYNYKFIPTEKFSKVHYAFYLNLFVDGGYVYDNHFYPGNALANQLLYSAGIGFDFVTYYDKVLRVEYSINKKGETGVFINFIAPI